MAKRINTDLGINVNLTDAPDIKTLAVANLPAPTGKNNFELLSDALGQFNPKIQELVKKEVQRENLETEVLGANTVNQMTLDDARKAHQEGFPSIYNGWARVGAYKQYAINSNEEFSNTMKKRYYENRNNPQYNWQNDYAELSQFYLKDKQQDPFFQSAFQKESVDTQKWITEQEFTFQIENLKTRVQQDTMYQLRVLPDKTLDTLLTSLLSTISNSESSINEIINFNKVDPRILEITDQVFWKPGTMGCFLNKWGRIIELILFCQCCGLK
jgi:hypothetical protein